MFTLEQAQEWIPHQDYDNHAAFVKIHNTLEPFGFVDTTWHNDECPSVRIVDDVTGDASVTLWVDYAAVELRAFEGATMFHVYVGVDVDFYVGDDIDAAINAALKAKG